MNIDSAEELFWENFKSRGELGASLSVWQNGREVLSLAGGYIDRQKERPWTAETPVLAWSTTKGPAAACLLHALERNGIGLDTPAAVFWPELKQNGKEHLSFGQILSHSAGLPALDIAAPVLDHDAVAAALAAQAPLWPLGQGHGYHPRTLGSLLDELVRRVDGMTMAQYWRTFFGVPLCLDFWMGLPPEKLKDLSPVHPARAPKVGDTGEAGRPRPDTAFYRALGDATSLTARAFKSPCGLESVASMNKTEARLASLPAFGGIGTARALGKFYAMLASGGMIDGVRFFESTKAMTTTLTGNVSAFDRVLLRDTAFSAGFMRDPVDAQGHKIRKLFGPSLTAFGQPGAGGSHAFADPENGCAFAYVMNQMKPGVLPNENSLGIVEALYGV